MSLFFIFFLLSFFIKEIHGKSEEYYKCLNPDKTVNSVNTCTNINIPYSDGYKCCSMKVKYESFTSYNCIVLDRKYTESQLTLNEYLSKGSLTSLLQETGGEIEIECENSLKMTKKYEKLSNEYLSCYNGHIKGVEKVDECNDYNIPGEEKGKCCFVETTKVINNKTKINDKRCYIIQDDYFTKKESLKNYLLDRSNVNNLDEIKNTDITINCKNYEPYVYKSLLTYDDSNEDPPEIEPKDKNKSGFPVWAIIIIVIGIIIIIVGGIFAYRRIKNSFVTGSNLQNHQSQQNQQNQQNQPNQPNPKQTDIERF